MNSNSTYTKFELLGSSESGDVTEDAKAALQGTHDSFIFNEDITSDTVELLFSLGEREKMDQVDFQFKVVHATSYRIVTDANGVETKSPWVSVLSI